jgi:hypothetical protein
MDVSGDSRATHAAANQRQMSMIIFAASTLLGGVNYTRFEFSSFYTRFECRFLYNRFECSLFYTRFECSSFYTRFECSFSVVGGFLTGKYTYNPLEDKSEDESEEESDESDES